MKGFQPRKDEVLQVSTHYLSSKYPHKQKFSVIFKSVNGFGRGSLRMAK